MNNIFLDPEIKSAFKNLLKKIKSCNIVETDTLVHAKEGLSLHTRFQLFFNFKPGSDLEAKLYEMILNHSLEAERLGPGSFDMIMQLLSEYSEKISADIPVSDFLEKNLMQSEIKPATISDVRDNVIFRLASINPMIASIFLEAVQLAGFGGKIIVEKTHALVPSVELTCGYSFDVRPAWPLSVKLENAKIFVIDGFIESVSEIHHLLEKQFETKDCSIIFARGMSPDVISTLRVNFERGTLKSVPVIVNFDLEGINTLNDLAIVSGGDVVSSNKGNLISSIVYDAVSVVNSVTVYPTKIVIQNSKTSKAVSIHASFLKNKRSESNAVEDIGKLYDKRIRSLSPNHVLIRLPDNSNFVKSSQAIDVSLRTLKSLLDYGIIEQEGKKIPAALSYAAGTYLVKCLKCISNLGAAIIE